MKKIFYNYMDENMPTPLSTGIGMYTQAFGPITGEFIGIVRLDEEDYLIARTISAFKDDPKYLDKIIVRNVFPDKYNNKLLIDRENNYKCKRMEEIFNNGSISADPIYETPSKEYDKLIDKEIIDVISVDHDYFEKQKMLIETGQIYPQQRQIKNY